MFRVFAFGFETCSKPISSLIYRLINEALLVADHISTRCHFSSWTYEVPRSCCHTSVKLLVILYFPVHHTWTRAPSCCDKTADFTPDLWPPNRPDLNPVDYRIWTVIQECIYQKQQLSSYIADKLWLLTKWHIIFHKVGYKHRVGEVGNYVAVLLQIYL